MAEHGLQVYCFFDVAGAPARAEGAAGGDEGAGAMVTVGWVDLGNPQT